MASYVTQMYASTQSLVEEPTNYVKQTVINANQTGQSIGEALISNIQVSLKPKFKSVYKYCATKHPWGLPKLSAGNVLYGSDQAKNVIEGIEGKPVNIVKYEYKENDWNSIGQSILYQEGMYIQVINRGTSALVLGNLPSGLPQGTTSCVYVNSTYIAADTIDIAFLCSPSQETVQIRYTNYYLRKDESAHFVMYIPEGEEQDASTTGLHRWFYFGSEGKYPELTEDETEITPLYPVLPVRHLGVNITDDPESELYLTTKRAMDFVGVDLDDIAEAVHGDPTMKNPGSTMYASIWRNDTTWWVYHYESEEPYNFITEVKNISQGSIFEDADSGEFVAWKRQAKERAVDIEAYDANQGKMEDVQELDNAMIVFGIPLGTDQPAGYEYLFEYFSELAPYNDYTKSTFDAHVRAGTTPTSNMVAYHTPAYKVDLTYYYIEIETFTGRISDKVTFTKTIEAYEDIELTGYSIPNTELILTKQNRDNTWVRLTVKGLEHGLSIGDGKYNGYYRTSLLDVDDLELFNVIVIPTSQTVLDKMRTFKAIDACSLSMNLVITSVDIIRLKWYQRTGFLKLIQGLAIIFSVVTFGKSLILAETIKAFVITSLTQIATSYVIVEGIKLAIEIFGIEGAAAILAVIAVAAYQGKFEFIAEYSSTLANALPSAEDFLEMVSSVTNSFTKALGQIMSEDRAEYEADMSALKEELKELEEMEKELEKGYEVDPMALVRTSMNMFVGENAEEFYNRTIHSGNIGVLSLDTIRYYVDEKLKLPTTTDTLLGV